MSKMKESAAMLEVRAWKVACDAEVAHLQNREAVGKWLANSGKVALTTGNSILAFATDTFC